MPVAWYIVPYSVARHHGRLARRCAIYAQLPTGGWAETEVAGDRAIVKVSASAGVLTTLNSLYTRLPKNALDTSLSDLTNGQKLALRDELEAQGYTLAEIQARFGNDLGASTLGDVLRFMTRRRYRLKPNATDDGFERDGSREEPCTPIADVDAAVS